MPARQNSPAFRHWQLEHDIDGVAWLTLDRADESANSLGREVLEELETLVAGLERDKPAGLVMLSGKRRSFIVGADVREFDQVADTASARQYIERVHALFGRIEALPFPTAVAFEGYCLGGGLELALCFDFRIARDIPETRIGFPEIKLGIFPGFGGTARTLHRLGGLKALPLILTARNVSARQARALGLIDQVIGRHQELRWAARRAVLKGRKRRRPGLLVHLVNALPIRRLLAKRMRAATRPQADPRYYPAPYDLLDAWEAHGGKVNALLAAEATGVARLLTGDTSRNLRRVFRLMELLKAEGKAADFKARRVHVIGAGVMGGDIAAWCVLQGLEVTLQDREMQYVEPALKRARQLFKRRLKTPERIAAASSRLRPDIAGHGAAHADVVIEAIFENLEAKQALFKDLEPKLKKGAVLATNTSALPLAELAKVLTDPGRLIGLHFFNPVAKMPLVEVVHDPELTRDEEIAKGAAVVAAIGKFPLRVKSSPGFLVNRVLGAYMMKALELHQEGYAKEALDRAAVDFGMPMGPVELADTVGLDVGLSVIRTLRGDAAAALTTELQKRVTAGKKGKKTGEGLYVWKKGKPVKDAAAGAGADLEQLAALLLQPYFDECRACLAERIAASADLIDAGMIFGTGFAPFRGGPLHYLEQTHH